MLDQAIGSALHIAINTIDAVEFVHKHTIYNLNSVLSQLCTALFEILIRSFEVID